MATMGLVEGRSKSEGIIVVSASFRLRSRDVYCYIAARMMHLAGKA
jgi:hypothetical protein